MPRMAVLSITLASLLVLGWVTRAIASPWRRVAVQKPFEQPERVDLAGLATIDLPPSFTPVGRNRDGGRSGFHPETLDEHRDDYEITFRFEQGQHHVLGGYLADPVLLHVALYNPGRPKPDATRITFTTIRKFYPPVDNDEARLNAHFAAQRWLPDVVTGDAITRTAATNEGRGDDLSSGPPERWLVIHVDPTRRIRIDLYAWRKMYSQDEAQSLVRRIAESVQTTPKLAAVFDGVKGLEAREDAQLEQAVSTALASLSQCGIRSAGPGMVAWSDRCASWLSDDRRFLRVARPLGRLPLASATGRARGAPSFRFDLPAGRSPTLGETNFRLSMLFWDDSSSQWKVSGIDHTHEEWEHLDHPLVSAIIPRLRDRTSVHLLALSTHDLKYHPERAALEPFFVEADRVAAALREGKVVVGVRASPYVFER